MKGAVSLEDEAHAASPRHRGLTAKNAILLLLVFLLVVSEFFLHNVIGFFPGTSSGRNATTSGIVLQGVCMVLLYAVVVHLGEEGVF